MISAILPCTIVLLIISHLVEGFTFSSLLNNKQQVSKIQKLWNKSLQESTVKVNDEIEILIDSYKEKTNEKFITGCFEAKPLITNKGDVPEWQKYSSFITRIIKNKKSNKNYQIFSSNSNKFYNLSEYNGNDFFATASGTYIKLENRKFLASVTEICIYFQFLQKLRKLNFNVNGNGTINIVYEDKEFRIVQNEKGARAIQTKVAIPNVYKDLLAEI